jgi:hypothetical protein
MIEVMLALIFICVILLSAIVSDEAWLLVTEVCNSLHVACASISGRSGRHVARGYGYPPRHRKRAVAL